MSDRVDALYAAPLDAFVAERGALAKALRAEGDRTAAAEVAGLRKPTAAAWTLNQIARAHPEAVDALLAATETLREATATGEGVREAIAAHREASRAILALAREQRPGGRPPTGAVLDRVRETLQAVALDPAVAGALRAGRLADEQRPDAIPDVGPGTDEAAERRAALERHLAGAEERVAAAREQAHEREAAAEAAAGKVQEARRALTRAEKGADAAGAAARDAATALADAEREAERIRAALRR